ncbi:fumarylacetoacetate hydrolase family protein [Alicyclobacillus cycloheptanicus]|uniref:2-keto-4-pentenoate hydratase/2-oxohepta-3-ene-1,7-dioic acid hydratase in catechol pathway n=1 Tax=Alicyclobacillus cycloheptanicus TaxID=1457 RepID=A0ABT9XM66_9BACL|nr:fumarylacetoacetate hydrolase family protein [Alicyclobacillus cycloheptanicus]MDQ0191406.1 2-keto-4-pentenoate hydratase/2-oxohepta-3-ene-1,7-dioic acid hydratase in catechol pathway [Alicyclobacillus cycloheptanicus]WDM00329.1 fumarylacetoacetate hydrolase family protein [Alicyclobacillus cycloheptanicus]
MKFLNIQFEGRAQAAVLVDHDAAPAVLPLSRLASSPAFAGNPLPDTVDELLTAQPEILEALRAQLSAGTAAYSHLFVPESEFSYLPCVPQPGKIICVGLNYRKHAEETRSPIPTSPIVFSKFSDTVAAHQEPIPMPRHATEIDYEGELCIVIGKEAKDVTEAQALDYVFGYCVANDISARELQRRTSQWLIGKTGEKFAPIGPYLVTADEVPNPNALAIQTRVNGETRQNSNTSDMIFSCKELISYLSQYIVLKPGDIILTGTPEGVILGYPKEQRVWLKAGDEVEITIEKLGTLKNQFVAP